jgi:hypothetical protein
MIYLKRRKQMPKSKEDVKLTKSGKPRKKPGRKKSKKNYYFHEGVQDAIVVYNSNPENHSLRNKIYQKEIHPAFDKLAENIINTFKFTYFDDPFEDVKHEVVAFMVMNMHKYDHTKGSKAFSYFSVVAKNYLILHNNTNYKKYKTHSDITSLNNSNKFKLNDVGSNSDMEVFTEELIIYFEETIPNIFKKKKDLDIAYSILELLRKRHDIENFNKKSLYILIREMTNVNTSSITSVVNVFKKHYKKVSNNFYSNGTVTLKKINLFF